MVEFSEFNYIAIVVAVLINMAAGALWYSPLLFAKPWMSQTGITREYMQEHKAEQYQGYFASIFASIIIVFTLALLVQLTFAETAWDGLVLGLFAGVGFVGTTQLTNYTFEAKSMSLYLINVGYPVLAFAGMGILLAVWL